MLLNQQESQIQSPPAREFLETLKVHTWLIVTVTGAAFAGALVYSLLQTPIYTSTAQVLVTAPTVLGQPGVVPKFNLNTEAAVAQSPGVAQLAAEKTGSDGPSSLLSGLSVSPAQDTEILTFQYSSSDAQVAQESAQAFADSYLEYRLDAVLESRQRASEEIENQIGDYRERLKDLESKADKGSSPGLNLDASIALLRNRFNTLRQIQIQQVSEPASNLGSVIRRAGLPTSPSSPRPVRNGLLALVFGLSLGTGLAFLRERLEDRLSGRADLESRAGVPVLAVIPRINTWKRPNQAYLVTEEEPQAVASEAYRTLRMALLVAASEHDAKTILITSAHESEGKSATSANLGVVLAQAGKRVILVSADLRRPRLHDFFGIDGTKGVTSILAGEVEVKELFESVGERMKNLQVLPTGRMPLNPAEILGSEAMSRLLARLRQAADFVLIDVPPVLRVADAMTLAPQCDQVLLVADASTTRSAVEQARHQLEYVSARLIGTVLNNVHPARERIYSYHHPDGFFSNHRRELSKSLTRFGDMLWSGPRR